MSNTLSESDLKLLRKKEARRITVARERANRLGTNLKPHIKGLIEKLAEEQRIPTRTLVRILLLEALEARGHNLLDVLKEWKERNPEASEEADAE